MGGFEHTDVPLRSTRYFPPLGPLPGKIVSNASIAFKTCSSSEQRKNCMLPNIFSVLTKILTKNTENSFLEGFFHHGRFVRWFIRLHTNHKIECLRAKAVSKKKKNRRVANLIDPSKLSVSLIGDISALLTAQYFLTSILIIHYNV